MSVSHPLTFNLRPIRIGQFLWIIDKFSSSDDVFYFLGGEVLGEEAKSTVRSQHEAVSRDELEGGLGPAGDLLHTLCNKRLHQHPH